MKKLFRIGFYIILVASVVACSSNNKVHKVVIPAQNFRYRLKAPHNQTYYFATSKITVNPGDLTSIRVQANYLVLHPTAKIRLEGNADARGSREYNIALGWRRAQAVARVLQEAGVSSQQITVISYGEERPVASAHTEAAYQLNRRVKLIYKVK